MIRTSGSPLPSGRSPSQSTSAVAALRAREVAVALAVAGVGVADALQSEPFDFRWLTTTVNRSPLAFCAEGLRQRRPVQRVDERADRRPTSSIAKAPTGVTAAGL